MILKTKNVRKDGSKCRKIDFVRFSGALLVSCSPGGFGGVFPYACGDDRRAESDCLHSQPFYMVYCNLTCTMARPDTNKMSKINCLIEMFSHDDCIVMIAVEHAECRNCVINSYK